MGQRVLLTSDVVGGVWDFCLVLSTALRDRHAASVTLLALGEPSADQRRQALASGAQLRSAPLKLEWMRDPGEDIARTQHLLADLVRELRPHVVHANQFAAASVELDVPVVLTVHSDVLSWRKWTLPESRSSGVPAEWQPYANLVAAALRRADSVVAVSHFLRSEISALYAVERPIEVIHNAWPAPPAADPPALDDLAPPTTLLAGRIWDAAKNVPLAAEAARGWNPGPVRLAGAQVDPDSGAQTGVPEPLQALGFLARSELDAWLRRSAIYLSPARYDPFGLLPLQAALHGCALLLSDIPSYRELWTGAACFFRSDDPLDLRLQWQRLVHDAQLRHKLRMQALERARTRFSPVRMLDEYQHVYDAVTAKRRVAA